MWETGLVGDDDPARGPLPAASSHSTSIFPVPIGTASTIWRGRISAELFLLAILAVIAVFAALGNCLESSMWH